MIRISISVGEALDRLSILEIKVNRLQKQTEVEAASKDLDLLRAELATEIGMLNQLPGDPLYQEIKRLNEVMWDAMQAIYDSKVVGEEAVTLTLEIIEVNKLRALTKRAIDKRAKSPILEAKSFF